MASASSIGSKPHPMAALLGDPDASPAQLWTFADLLGQRLVLIFDVHNMAHGSARMKGQVTFSFTDPTEFMMQV